MAYVSDERFRPFGRTVWNVRMQIVDDGEHFAKRLPFYLNSLARGKRAPSSHFVMAWATATHRKPPKDLWRRRPRWFLAGCYFRAYVCTITKNAKQVEYPPALHRSRVGHLIELVAGVPPCLR